MRALRREVEHVTGPYDRAAHPREQLNVINARVYARVAETRSVRASWRTIVDVRPPPGGQEPISVSTSSSGLREMSGTRAFADG